MIKDEFSQRYRTCIINNPIKCKLTSRVEKPKIFDVDRVFIQGKGSGDRCDEFIFFDLGRDKAGIYLIERKDGQTKTEKIQKQLQGGANFINNFLCNEYTGSDEFDFLPVLIAATIPSGRSTYLRQKIFLKDLKRNIAHIEKNKELPLLKDQK